MLRSPPLPCSMEESGCCHAKKAQETGIYKILQTHRSAAGIRQDNGKGGSCSTPPNAKNVPLSIRFMSQKSTEDSLYTLIKHVKGKLEQKKLITMVSLDIEGVFDSARWPAIVVRMAEEKCPVNLWKLIGSYLRDRKISVRYGGEQY